MAKTQPFNDQTYLDFGRIILNQPSVAVAAITKLMQESPNELTHFEQIGLDTPMMVKLLRAASIPGGLDEKHILEEFLKSFTNHKMGFDQHSAVASVFNELPGFGKYEKFDMAYFESEWLLNYPDTKVKHLWASHARVQWDSEIAIKVFSQNPEFSEKTNMVSIILKWIKNTDSSTIGDLPNNYLPQLFEALEHHDGTENALNTLANMCDVSNFDKSLKRMDFVLDKINQLQFVDTDFSIVSQFISYPAISKADDALVDKICFVTGKFSPDPSFSKVQDVINSAWAPGGYGKVFHSELAPMPAFDYIALCLNSSDSPLADRAPHFEQKFKTLFSQSLYQSQQQNKALGMWSDLMSEKLKGNMSADELEARLCAIELQRTVPISANSNPAIKI